MRSVVTVLGTDRTGIIAKVSSVLATQSINILDISQTTMEGTFVMIMMVDMSQSKCNTARLQELLHQAGESLKMTINVYHEDVFRMMHRI